MELQINNKFEKFNEQYFARIYNKEVFLAYDILQNGTYIEMDQSKTMKSYIEIPLDSYYRVTKIYFPNGNIKSKGLSANTGYFLKGSWYEFDEIGNLIKEVDYDKPFKFTFEDILSFCEKSGIKVEKGYISQTGRHTIISRSVENGQPLWKIEYVKKIGLIEILTLDGITGKVLKKEEQKYDNN